MGITCEIRKIHRQDHPEINNCPFCGDSGTTAVFSLMHLLCITDYGCVQCGNCLSRGPAVKYSSYDRGWEKKAVREWNKRHKFGDPVEEPYRFEEGKF